MTKEDRKIVWNGIKGLFVLIFIGFAIYFFISFMLSPEGQRWSDNFLKSKLVDLNIRQYIITLIISLSISKWFYPFTAKKDDK